MNQRMIVVLLCAFFCTSFLSVIAAEDPNGQVEKIHFVTVGKISPDADKSGPVADKSSSAADTLDPNISTSFIQRPMSPYQLMAGTVIPCTLITGVNSDLPGHVLGQVSQNIYNTVNGKYLVIPQGTKILGEYDSNVNYGQSRVLIVWTRLIFPNGSSLTLDRLEGMDMSGYNGLHDKVDNHTGRIIGSAVVGSLLSAAAQIATSHDSNDNSYSAAAGSGVAQNVANTAQSMLNKDLGIQPTLTIRPGYKFNVLILKDILFLEPYKE